MREKGKRNGFEVLRRRAGTNCPPFSPSVSLSHTSEVPGGHDVDLVLEFFRVDEVSDLVLVLVGGKRARKRTS